MRHLVSRDKENGLKIESKKHRTLNPPPHVCIKH